jgi:hypothetical protein
MTSSLISVSDFIGSPLPPRVRHRLPDCAATAQDHITHPGSVRCRGRSGRRRGWRQQRWLIRVQARVVRLVKPRPGDPHERSDRRGPGMAAMAPPVLCAAVRNLVPAGFRLRGASSRLSVRLSAPAGARHDRDRTPCLEKDVRCGATRRSAPGCGVGSRDRRWRSRRTNASVDAGSRCWDSTHRHRASATTGSQGTAVVNPAPGPAWDGRRHGIGACSGSRPSTSSPGPAGSGHPGARVPALGTGTACPGAYRPSWRPPARGPASFPALRHNASRSASDRGSPGTRPTRPTRPTARSDR